MRGTRWGCAPAPRSRSLRRREIPPRASAGSRAQAASANQGDPPHLGAAFMGISPHLLLYYRVRFSISYLRAPRSAVRHGDSFLVLRYLKSLRILMQPELLEAAPGDIPLQQEVPAQAIPQAAELQTHIQFLCAGMNTAKPVSNDSPKFLFQNKVSLDGLRDGLKAPENC